MGHRGILYTIMKIWAENEATFPSHRHNPRYCNWLNESVDPGHLSENWHKLDTAERTEICPRERKTEGKRTSYMG